MDTPKQLYIIPNPQQLVPVFTANIGGKDVHACDARELHAYLCAGWKFADWIKDRIETYGFMQDVDFIVIPNLTKDDTAFGGRRKTIEYHITLDMAKEVAMVENNDKGREVRRYFIEMERKALASVTTTVLNPANLSRLQLIEIAMQAI